MIDINDLETLSFNENDVLPVEVSIVDVHFLELNAAPNIAVHHLFEIFGIKVLYFGLNAFRDMIFK